MKTMKRVLSLVLVVAMLMSFAVTASADAQAEIKYEEAVELMTALHVVAALDGKDLTATLTRNEAAAMINVLSTPIDRPIAAVGTDYNITGEEFFTLIDAVLCKDGWFNGFRHVNAWLHNYLTGLGEEYTTFAARTITAEEACQVLMNALDAKVEFEGNQWYLREELGLIHEFSTDDANTDMWGRPVSRWTKDGTALTKWYTASAAWVGEGTITTHDLLERLGVFDYGSGNFQNNTWCMFSCNANGGAKWQAGKLHWNHDDGSGCQHNWVSQRPGSRMEVYFMGEGYNNIPDAGGTVWSRNYYVVYIDEYLAYIEDQTIEIYSNENGAIWSWSAPELPTTDGWYIINLNLKDQATAIPVQLAEVFRSSQNGMELPASDGFNYVYTNYGRLMLSSKCHLGYDIIGSMDYYNSRNRVNFLLNTWGRVIGAIDGELVVPTEDHEHDWNYFSISNTEHEKWCDICNLTETEFHTVALDGKTEATETNSGYTGDPYCTVCSVDLGTGEVIDPHAHVYADEWHYDADIHWQNCVVGNCNHQGNLDEHNWQYGECTECGMSEGESVNPLWWLVIAGGASGCPFDDVPSNAWYREYVVDGYQEGLIDGMTKDKFAPNENLTVAQAIKLAAVLYKKLNHDREYLANGEGKWYSAYVDYAVRNGIIEEKYQNYTASQMNAAISRQEFVHILYGAAKNFGYYVMNDVADNSIPDVKSGSAYASEIYTFYRAGILTGNDEAGTFRPTSNIKRSEVAAILVRMYDESARCTITLG